MASVQSIQRPTNTLPLPLVPSVRQVLLIPSNPRMKPVTIWVPESEAVIGSYLSWRGCCWKVSAIYGTHVTSNLSSEVARSERPHKHRQACVRIDTAD